VLNEDVIKAGKGFGMHGHKDMEIVTIVLSGELTHEDSMGNKGTISEYNVQRMSAGTGVRHSETNNGKKPVHLLQIWITPERKGISPSYEQHAFKCALNEFTLIASYVKDPTAVYLHQDATMHLGKFKPGAATAFTADPDKGAYVFVIHGELSVEGKNVKAGDALAITEAQHIRMQAMTESDVLVIQVPV